MCACGGRFIIPTRVLRRLAEDESIPAESREAMRDSVAVEESWRGLRNAQTEAILAGASSGGVISAIERLVAKYLGSSRRAGRGIIRAGTPDNEASVLGAASTMRDLAAALSDTEKRDLLATVIDESERLNRFIANLLDMTKLESGAIVPNTALHDLSEIVGSALRRAAKILTAHKVELVLAADLPMLQLDAVLFEQVLFNLLDNAAKYSPAETTISIKSQRERDQVMLQIADEGDGIPPDELESVFDKFYRAQKGDRVRPGTGLGLAISRGFVEAMQGTISAANRSDRSGAVLTIRLPVPAQTQALDTAA